MRSLCVRFLLCALALTPSFAAAQSIFTIAGGGSKDNRPATSLSLADVGGMAVDAQGNVYFSEPSAHVVQRLDIVTGTLSVYAGNGGGSFGGDGGPAFRASLKNPRGLVFDAEGNLYIADHDNNRIRRVDGATRIITTIAGIEEPPDQGIGDDGPAVDAWIYQPAGLAWNSGNLYVTQRGYNENRVRRIDPDGFIRAVAGTGPEGFSGDGGPATSAQLNVPNAIAIDANGNLYIADSGNHSVRRVSSASGTIETVIGGKSPDDDLGDGGPGTDASLFLPLSLALDSSGRLLVADTYHSRIRRWDPATDRIITIAGNGEYGGGDGRPALEAGLYAPFAIALDAEGNLFVHDGANQSVRRIDATTTVITTVAGGGDFIGDGLVATNALLSNPRGVAIDGAGHLYIADSGHTVVRKVDAQTGVISTFAGQLAQFYGGEDGVDATQSVVGGVSDLAVNMAGDLYVADPHNGKIRVIDRQGKINTYAGGGSPADGLGDNGPATGARIQPAGIALDTAGNLYILDVEEYPGEGEPQRHRLRKVDAQSKVITTIAGGATPGRAGDGGPASAALLDSPTRVAVDAAGNIFISDTGNGVIRRIDATSGFISTYAGGGEPADGIGDDLPATGASLGPVALTVDRRTGALYVADNAHLRIRKIDATTRIITTVAGSASFYLETGFSGDNGRATDAKLNFQYDTAGLAVDATGNLFIADTVNRRIRSVPACVAVGAPTLTAPVDGATSTSTAPVLSWQAGSASFRYDVRLDTNPNPQRLVAVDIDRTTFSPSNLLPNTKYYWTVTAKGDPFCDSLSNATSSVRSFTTSGDCTLPPFNAVSPADGAGNVASPVQFSWQSVPGATSYDLYLGASSPPSLFASGITATTFSASVTGRNFWFVVAHAACDEAITSRTPIRSFTTAGPVCVPGSLGVNTTSPADGANDVPISVDLSWNSNSGTSFDLYFGTTTTPPLHQAGLTATRSRISGLQSGTTYSWRVVAKNDCQPGGVSSSLARFTTLSCPIPAAPSITFVPSTVAAGSTYAIVWAAAGSLEADGAYLVERSLSESFSSRLDAQVTRATSATFLAASQGIVYHRVTSISACDPARGSPPSATRAVTVTAARPSVVFTVQPAAQVTSLGEPLEERRGSFTLENIGSSPVQVLVGRQEINNSPPFFSIIDPRGNDAAFVTLDPQTPRTFEISYSGPRVDVAGSYEGIIFVASTGEGLAVTPYAFVNLKVGGGTGATPEFRSGTLAVDYAAFDGFPSSSDDSTRSPLQVTIHNPGPEPMELAAEIGPEVWLTPERGWNATPLAPGASRTINLRTDRSRAPNGSSLPRYTYFTVRTRSGTSARLLVQDNDAVTPSPGRSTRLEPSARSIIVPEVVSRLSSRGVPVVSRLAVTNSASEPVPIEVIFTPEGSNGFDELTVRRAVLTVPANDVVTIRDPLTRLFDRRTPGRGNLELRVPRERVGVISASASLVSLRNTSVSIPVVARGDGARAGVPLRIIGARRRDGIVSSLTLTETTGLDSTTVTVRLLDAAGQVRGELSRAIQPYGYVRVDDVVAEAGLQILDVGALLVSVADASGASVTPLLTISDANGEAGAVLIGGPDEDAPTATELAYRFQPRAGAVPTVNKVSVVPIMPPASVPVPIEIMLSALPNAPAVFTAILRNPIGAPVGLPKNITVPAGSITIFKNVISEIFDLPPTTTGSVAIESTAGGKVTAVLQGGVTTVPPSSGVPIPTNASDLLTGGAGLAQRPLFYDGLEQSTDPTRGSRWLLVLNEVAGASGTVRIALYESGNRVRPIADRTIAMAAHEQVTLDSVFSELGLDSAARRKDRTNVLVMVAGITGGARVAATTVSVDNRTGDTKLFALTPSGTSSMPSISLVTPILPPPQPLSPRRRGVRH